MIRDIKGIKIKGKCFLTEAKLDFFAKKEIRISIIYGRNGSGKTTISEGIFNIKNQNVTPYTPINVSFFDEQNNYLSDINYSNIFVFNEHFCEDKIKIAEGDGLKTILLFGKQVENADKIKTLQNEIECLKLEQKNKNISLKTYTENKGLSNPDTYLSRIFQTLKDKWAGLDAALKGKKVNSPVNRALIDEIINIHDDLTEADLIVKFNNQKSLYEKINGNIERIQENISIIYFNNVDEENIIDLLATKIERPTLTEREQRIFDTMQEKMNNFVDESKELFLDSNINYCPYCYQEISQNYRNEILNSINKILNRDVDNHRIALQEKINILPNIYINEKIIQTIDKTLFDKVSPIAKQCYDKIEQYKKLMEEKIKNSFKPINVTSLSLSSSINNLNIILREIEQKRLDFNAAIQKKNEEKEKLIDLNKRVARYSILENYNSYKNFLNKKDLLINEIKNVDNLLISKETELTKLQEQNSNESLAVDKINNALNYIFFSESRFSVELKNKKYYLKSNGKDVSPKDVSVGERNILALCYFFTKMMTGKEIDSFYSDEKFIIIDDPVSSFDFENKIGIISYLRHQINLIIKGNPTSKVLIFSHDLETIYNLDKAMDEICKTSNGNAKKQVSELSMHNIQNYNTERKSEYGQLLNDIYKYACNLINDTNIGNKMRKVLEAFATFNYQKGIEEISYNEKIKEILGEQSSFFESLMYRLLLNGESHYKERVNMMFNGYNFSQLVSEEERRKTARYVLCFLFIINPLHISFYLENDNKDATTTILKWKNDIPTNDHM